MRTYPLPSATLTPNTPDYERLPLIKPTGFREYDARWLFGPELNLMGVQYLGMGLGTLIKQRGVKPEIVVGHDYRSYSAAIKLALTQGLMATGCTVHDIGLAVTPAAYYAQFALDVPCVAQVTASHNENGWTGVKMGMNKPLTFGPDEMSALKDITLNTRFDLSAGGAYHLHTDFAQRYIAHLTDRKPFTRNIRAVVACGNGTAGAFAPQVLGKLGIEVIQLHCTPNHTFPNYNANPEDMEMLHDMAAAVKHHNADLALGFDGDGDRCGVVDNTGAEIFSDKLGVLIARNIAKQHAGAQFVVDVKSTSLYNTDPVLTELGAKTDYFKTGHSYIKRRTTELNALAGFEKSGHFFFRQPYGLGYDDALVSALMVLDMLDANPDKSMADLVATLPVTHGSPTMSPHCPDEEKYGVIDAITAHFQQVANNKQPLCNLPIIDINTVNGVRVTLEDGTWGLIRASSNKPELVVVVESPVSEAQRNAIFAELKKVMATHPAIGAFNQSL
ncbi:MAG: phosphomannomutase/phosphoglucomutase [Pseudomonadaceae bacterium]|nr:phosphomannomutase/phosphoglucomutase [Pseudomonadaceae bacterium]